jgi:sugar fermentation stimulation protein A
MRGLSAPGSRVMVSRSDNLKRKLPYSLELVEAKDNEPVWVGVNTNLPNQVVKLALEKRLFPQLGSYDKILAEVNYDRDKKSRVDFFLPGSEENLGIYLEVKNVTWASGRTALFPDAATLRGQKHLLEMMKVLRNKMRAVTLFFVNRSDCDEFSTGDIADPMYGKLLKEAIALGLEVLPCRFETTPEGIRYLGLAELKI